jgi:hypothetical protein
MMTMVKELATELIGMFFAEKRLAIDPLVGGAVLLFGCLILLIESVCRAARVGAS